MHEARGFQVACSATYNVCHDASRDPRREEGGGADEGDGGLERRGGGKGGFILSPGVARV